MRTRASGEAGRAGRRGRRRVAPLLVGGRHPPGGAGRPGEPARGGRVRARAVPPGLLARVPARGRGGDDPHAGHLRGGHGPLGGPRSGARRSRHREPLAARAAARFLRSVPDLVWALLFVVAFGLGPLPGTLALGVSYAGVLGRVYADLFEAVPEGPVLALHSAGASRLQVFAAAIWPQAAGSVTAYTLYSFECCVRSAAVLGFVGAGGIGAEINLSMRLFEYGQVTTLLAAFVTLVLCVDALSRALRGRFRRNAVHGSG